VVGGRQPNTEIASVVGLGRSGGIRGHGTGGKFERPSDFVFI